MSGVPRADRGAGELEGFVRALGLAPGAGQVPAAAEAIKKEYRRTSRAVSLTCYAAQPIQEEARRLFRLDVGRFVDVDWTWEGARAGPWLEDGADPVWGATEPEREETSEPWSGEIVEADETSGHLYVLVTTLADPVQGRIAVRPFEFLRSLHEIYNGDASPRLARAVAEGLAASEGREAGNSLPPRGALPALRSSWGHAWSLVWGPPGTGKTFTIGRQVAQLLGDATERVLVVSTTNKSTDGVAVQIGRGLRERGAPLGGVLRLGKGANIERFEGEGLEDLLSGGDAMLRHELSDLIRQRDKATEPAIRARLAARISETRRALRDAESAHADPRVRLAICTVFRSLSMVLEESFVRLVEAGLAPFTTVVIDEAGLVSRAACAALGLLAARRVVLVGDPQQLAPISRMARILQPEQARWLARSGLSHLDARADGARNMTLLRRQYRMCPDIRAVVSGFMYQDRLTDADEVDTRRFAYDDALATLPKAVWYVLDEDAGETFSQIRAERGPGNRSWLRRRTVRVMEKLFQAHPRMAQGSGLFLSPFVAQTQLVRSVLSARRDGNWQACTVHSQQGAEADYVVFDTVHAGSTAWPYDEWRRLINVALSRARQFVVVLASRLEMQEPYLAQVCRRLSPFVLRRRGSVWKWEAASADGGYDAAVEVREHGAGLGAQIERRKALRPILSAEQQRLCAYKLDGKPRLVRGVAGSGKSLVLAHWLSRTLADDSFEGTAWVVYANKALRGLLDRCIQEAWGEIGRSDPLPMDRYRLMWIEDVLVNVAAEFGVRAAAERYDYNGRADAILTRVPRERVVPRCGALFVDEAQDFGPRTLELLAALVRPSGEDPAARPAMIFYDNAQDVYRRGVPKWSDLGLDMVGRSTVMRESFRSTRVVSEFALNVLYRLEPPEKDPDHRELLQRGLVEKTERDGEDWWNVHFNQVDGPPPQFRKYPDRESELVALAGRVERWIAEDRVRPGDIKILCNSTHVREGVLRVLEPVAQSLGARLEEQRNMSFSTDDRALIVSTAHSFKGYEAEIVAVPGADAFVARGVGVLAAPLYVAMTRARSILSVTATAARPGSDADRIVRTLDEVSVRLSSPPLVAQASTDEQHVLELSERLDPDHRGWLEDLALRFRLDVRPIVRADGSILAQPLFCLDAGGRRYACFGGALPLRSTIDDLRDHRVRVIRPGEEPG